MNILCCIEVEFESTGGCIIILQCGSYILYRSASKIHTRFFSLRTGEVKTPKLIFVLQTMK